MKADEAAAGHREAQSLEPADVSLKDQIDEEIRSGRAVPQVMPQIGARVRQVTTSENYPLEDLTAVIEQEPALAARILRYANASAFAGLAEITELHQAVTRLGATTVESVAVAAATRELYKARSTDEAKTMTLLWKHAVACGEVGRLIAKQTYPALAEEAFLTCLLHDVGWVVIVRALGNIEDRTGSPVAGGLRQEVLGSLHARCGARLLESWSVPESIREAVLHHHEPESAGGQPLPHIVNMADGICHRLGAAQTHDPNLSLLALPSAAFLKLDDLRMAALLVDAEDALATAAGLE